jgi:hypothetical protein
LIEPHETEIKAIEAEEQARVDAHKAVLASPLPPRRRPGLPNWPRLTPPRWRSFRRLAPTDRPRWSCC